MELVINNDVVKSILPKVPSFHSVVPGTSTGSTRTKDCAQDCGNRTIPPHDGAMIVNQYCKSR